MGLLDISEILNKMHKKIKAIKESKEWKDMFLRAGDSILSREFDQRELFDQLAILFSKKNLKRIAKENKDTGLYLIENVEKELVNYFSEKELYSEERKKYIDIFINDFKNRLKECFPKQYEKVFVHDLRSEISESHDDLIKSTSEINRKMDELRKVKCNCMTCMTCMELNDWYISNTNNGCTLELFNHENKEFTNNLLSQLDNEIINVKGENISETVAYISYLFMNDERFEEYKERLCIVKDIESWKFLCSNGTSGFIYINGFFSKDSLEVIQDNTCIFNYNKKLSVYVKNVIELEQRFFRNLNGKLESCGYEHQNAYDIAKASKNNYTILMRKLFLGKISEPLWAKKEHYNLLLPALITNKWLDDDQILIELLLEDKIKFEDYLEELIKIDDEQDPFLVNFRTWYHSERYLVSDPEAAWDYFSDFVDDILFMKIEQMMELIFNEINPKFDLPLEEHYIARVKGKNPQFSDELKFGFIETLIFISKQNTNVGNKIKKEIENIVAKVTTNKEWFAISELLPMLVEINPEAVIGKYEEELKRDESGLVNLFVEKSDGGIVGRSYYTHVIWSLEKALYIEDYSFRSIKVLSMLMDYDIEYKMSNSPLNTLYESLVAWSHAYIYSIEEKIEFVKYVVQNSKNGWKLLIKLLPSNSGGTISSLSKPKFLQFEISDELKFNDQVFKTYLEYYRIAFENINGSVENLCAFYDNTLFVSFGIYEQLKEITLNLLKGFSDIEKYILYKKVFVLISRNRHFQDADWAINEKYLNEIELKILNKIHFKDESYKYQHIFESYNDILLNPIPYNEDSQRESIKMNDNLKDELRRESINKLIKLDINWCEFIIRFESNSSHIIGSYIVEIECDIDFIVGIVNCLKDNEKYSIISSLFGKLYSLNGISNVDSIVHDCRIDDIEVIKIALSSIRFDAAAVEFLDSIDENLKSIFWSLENYHYIIKEDYKEYALTNYLKYKNPIALLKIAGHYKFDTKDLISVLKIVREEFNKRSHLDSYSIEKIFKSIYEDSFPREDIIKEVSDLEISYLGIIKHDIQPKYLAYRLSQNPEFVAELIGHAYKTESEESIRDIGDEEKLYAEISHSILFSVKFIPTEKIDGEIEYEELKAWCDKYIEIITAQDQRKIGLQYIGKFLTNSKKIKEGEFPQESVKRVIEDIYDEQILRGFTTAIWNGLGARTISDGSDYYALYVKYKEYADNSKLFPHTQKILRRVADSFYRDYENEKASAKYEEF